MIRSIMCASCSHFHRANAGQKPPWTCEAFPDGIPVEIRRGFVFHDRELPGDHGIRFEPREPEGDRKS